MELSKYRTTTLPEWIKHDARFDKRYNFFKQPEDGGAPWERERVGKECFCAVSLRQTDGGESLKVCKREDVAEATERRFVLWQGTEIPEYLLLQLGLPDVRLGTGN